MIGRDVPQSQRLFFGLVAFAPTVVLFFHAWFGQIPGLRWLHHRTQPRLVIGASGLETQGPRVSPHVYGWSEIGGLRTRPLGDADLVSPDGIALARIPQSLILGNQGGFRSDTVASLVVLARPDRYRLSRANWAGVPIEFSLRDADEPIVAIDPWAARRRWINVAIFVAGALVTAFLVYRYATA